ncbi:hypothetical protein ACFC25_13550 [Pseudarthrobacter sp. NPDC055928]
MTLSTTEPGHLIRNGDGTVAGAWGGFNPGKMDEWAPVLPTVEEAAQAD